MKKNLGKKKTEIIECIKYNPNKNRSKTSVIDLNSEDRSSRKAKDDALETFRLMKEYPGYRKRNKTTTASTSTKSDKGKDPKAYEIQYISEIVCEDNLVSKSKSKPKKGMSRYLTL